MSIITVKGRKKKAGFKDEKPPVGGEFFVCKERMDELKDNNIPVC